jgi:hypothetical protein
MDDRRTEQPNCGGLTWLDTVEKLCAAFEHEWNEGRCPPIEVFLQDLAGTNDPAPLFLAELLGVEIESRRRRGENPTSAEYLERFPQHGEIICQLLGGSGSGSDKPISNWGFPLSASPANDSASDCKRDSGPEERIRAG